MESLFLLLGIVGLIGLLGGFLSFFSILGGGDEKARLKRRLEEIELQLQELSVRIDELVKQDPVDAAPTSSPVNTTTNLTTQSAVQTAIEPIATDEAELERQALEASVLESEAIQEASTTNSEKAEWSQKDQQTRQATSFSYESVSNQPSIIEKGFLSAKNWLFGGNTLVRSGIVILFIGISFLLKYAAEHTHVPIELRLTGIALSGVALLALGWRLRGSRAEYSWAIQGGGIGILYLTIFAALKLYQLIPPNIAFLLLVIIAFLSALIAVLQSAQALAVLGFAGGFLAPILTSSGHSSHVGLFSYYLVLNLGIAFVALHKSWRPLNVLGFVFTFVIGTLWGTQSYVPEYFTSTEPFLIIHFLLFTLIAVLYAFQQSTKVSDYVDATLVFGTPIVAFGLQYAMLSDSHFGLAYSALALAVFYIGLAWWILTRKSDTVQFLGECFLALGVGFSTLTLPLALDGRWTSAAWAVEGVGLVWVGLRQRRTLPLLAGLALQLLAAEAFVNGWGLTGYTSSAHQNMFLGVAFIALSGWACGALLNHYLAKKTKALSTLLALWGWLWWIGAGITANNEFLPTKVFTHANLLFIALTSLLLPVVSRWLRWPFLASLSALLLPAMAIATLADASSSHPTQHFGWLAWPLTFAIQAWLLQQNTFKPGALMRAPVLWILAILGGMEWNFWLQSYIEAAPYQASTWQDIGWAIVPVAIVASVLHWQQQKTTWDTSETVFTNSRAWLWFGCAPLVLFLLGWFGLMSLCSSGDASPLPYLPLLNPLDIALSAVLLILLIWKRRVTTYFIAGSLTDTLNRLTPPLAGLMAFALLNGMLLRTLHYWAGTPFAWTAIFDSTLVQVSFTFLWGITALALMLIAYRLANRKLWITGAALMGLVVLKLFLLDLAEHGSVERIISFIGAGILLLVMGYFAPLPPAKAPEEEEAP